MSLRYRDSSGVETIVSGLTPGGDIEAGAVATRTGTYDLSGLNWVQQNIVFDSPMPDADYEIITEEHQCAGFTSGQFLIQNKTANGFTIGIYFTSTTAANNRYSGTWKAVKTYSVQHAAQNAEDIANIKAAMPSSASSTNKLATSNDVSILATSTDSRLDDLEDLVPTGASVSNQLATKDNIDTVTANANSRLKVVNIIPSTPVDGDVILYTGNEAGYRKGGIYQYAATSGAWVLISTADVDLSHYETSFTGTTAQWNALSSIEKDKYDLVNLTDDNERDIGDHYSTNEQRVGSWIDGKPLYKISFKMSIPSVSTKPSGSLYVSKDMTGYKIKEVVKIDTVSFWQDRYYFPADTTVTSDQSITSSTTSISSVNYTRCWYDNIQKTFNYEKNPKSYQTNTDLFVTLYYTKTTD